MKHTLIVTGRRSRVSHARGAVYRTAAISRKFRLHTALLAATLSVTLLLSPILRVYADEGAVVVPDADIAAVEPAATLDLDVHEPSSVDEEVSVDTFFEDSTVDDQVSVESVAESEEVAAEITPVSSDVASTTLPAVAPEEIPLERASSTPDAEAATTTDPVVISTDSATSTTSASSTVPELPGADMSVDSPEPAVVQDDTEAESPALLTEEDATLATTTPLPEGQVVNFVTNDENRFTFSPDDCVSVGDGSFYCTEASASVPSVQDGAVALMDASGDREIYFTKRGAQVQVTDNDVDDAAPFYDPVSTRIVWHSLKNDRYQIMSYDTSRREVRALTDESYNNMEPSAYGDITLWQAWINGNWEIMQDDDGEVSQLTDNETHDVAPHIRGDFIIWQSFEGDAWRVKVLDQNTGLIDTIDGGAAGTSLENPRFVLVYDSKKENGDVETLGYDFDSRSVIPLASTPAPIPERVPEPEEDGEERALVQPTQTRTELRPEDGDGSAGGGDGDGDGSGAATTTTEAAVSDSSQATSTDALSEFDLVITVPELGVEDTQEDVASSTIVSDNDEQ